MFSKLYVAKSTAVPGPVRPNNDGLKLLFNGLVKTWACLIFGSFFGLTSCTVLDRGLLLQSDKDYQDIRDYESNYGSRIEVFLDIAEIELVENYKKKKFLMIRKDQPRALVHTRKDLSLRQFIDSAYEAGDISKDELNRYIRRCDDLHTLWLNQWQSADKKARILGYER